MESVTWLPWADSFRGSWVFSKLASQAGGSKKNPKSGFNQHFNYWKRCFFFPNPNSPANSQAAQLYQENKREYEKRVTAIVEQSWVDVWASSRLYLLLPLHRPLFFIIPVLQSLIFTSSRKKNSNYIRKTQVPPWKNGRIKQPNQNGH